MSWTRNYTSGSSNRDATITYSYTDRLRNAHRDAGWWGVLDSLGHRLHVPQRILRPICDRYDIALGVPKADIIATDYKGRAPWWLR